MKIKFYAALLICLSLSACQNTTDSNDKLLGMFEYTDANKCTVLVEKGREPMPVFFTLMSQYEQGTAASDKLDKELKAAIDRGCDINEKLDGLGLTPLHLAVLHQLESATAILVDGGADINSTIDKKSNAIDGKTVVEFSEALKNKDPSEARDHIHQTLLSH